MSSLEHTLTEADGEHVLSIKGVINEEADLAFMKEIPAGKVIVNTRDVDRINSCGVREWIQALKEIPEGCELHYVECSPAFLDQINMISNFIGDGKVESMYIPYICEDCDTKKDELIDLNVCLKDDELELPEIECSECKEAMELGDDPDQLFGFLE